MTQDNFIIRKMQEPEIQIAIDWARKEGWNPGLHDATCFYQTDPNGFFIATLNDEIIGTGSAVAYDDKFGFCGFYIVKEPYRHHGYGMEITKRRLSYLGERIVGIDGVLENVSKYERIGYVAAHKSIRFELKKNFPTKSDSKVVLLKEIPFVHIEKFDRNYFPTSRSKFLSCWINQPESYALGYNDGNLKGYGVIRKCNKGFKIGPLFAESYVIADSLFNMLCSKVDAGPIYLDVPEINKNAMRLAENYKMTSCFEVIRMYRNGKPDFNIQGVYGNTTFELG